MESYTLNKRDFAKIRKELEAFDAKRETIIKGSRDALKNSKRAIFSVHRNKLSEARTLLLSAKKKITELKNLIRTMPGLDAIGAFSCAMQEYVEAMSYYMFVKSGKLPTRSSLGAAAEDYLMGLCDLTGELARRAVMFANKDREEVKRIKDFVEELYGEFLKFDFRNGDLRKKFDAIKWNLKKIDEVVYAVEISG